MAPSLAGAARAIVTMMLRVGISRSPHPMDTADHASRRKRFIPRSWKARLLVGTLVVLALAEALRNAAARDEQRSDPPWYAPTAYRSASGLTMGVSACVGLESRIRLARIALADHQRGRAAAFELLDRSVDPASDGPIARRDEADGSVALWCMGHDGDDDVGLPPDDVVWWLPPPR